MGKYVLFREYQQSNIIKRVKEVKEKSAEEILEMFQHQDLILFVVTPFFSEPIDKYSIPLQLYPEVIIKTNPHEKNEIQFDDDLPNSYFCFKQLTFPHQISLYVHSDIKDAQIPPFEVIIDLDSAYNGNDICQLIDNSFTMEHSDSKTPSFNMEDEAKSIILKSRTKNILFQCKLADSAYKLMKKRVNVLSEIQETEQNYINDIRLLIDFWEPTIRQLKLFNEIELIQIFKDFPTIFKCHQTFLNALKKRKCNFATMVGDIFLEFSDYFKLSLPYISNYHNIIQIINSKPKVLSINAPEDGKDLTSYLITPVQHIPRYILFLRELLKKTPSFHPDYEELELACSRIQNITVEMDISTKRAHQMNEIWMIQKSLAKPLPLISPNRCLKDLLNITFKSEPCKLYVFNDFIMITSSDKKSQTVLFSSPILSFHYFLCFGQIGLQVKKKIYYAAFQNEQARLDFVSNVEDLRLSQDKKNLADLSLFLWSNPFVPKFLPKLSFIDGVQVNDSYVFFGDGTLVTVNMNLCTVNSSPSPFGSRYGFAMVGNSTDKIFIIGGFNKQADEYFNDIWQYEIFQNKWTNLTRHNYRSTMTLSLEFQSRCEHSAIYDENKIYIFGGRCRKNYFNDISIFYLETKKWNILKLDFSPAPRSLHSAVMVDKKIIILGGHNSQTVFNDVNVFDTNSLKWNAVLVNCSVIPKRYGHRSIAIRNMIITIGGTADGESVPNPTVIHCANNYSCKSYKCAGNNPFDVFVEGGFGICFDAERLSLYVYNHCSIFLVQLPQEIKHSYINDSQSELHGRLFHTTVSNAKRLSVTLEEGDVFQSIQNRRRMQKFGTCYTPKNLDAFPRPRARMHVNRKAIAMRPVEIDLIKTDDEKLPATIQECDIKKKPSTFSLSDSSDDNSNINSKNNNSSGKNKISSLSYDDEKSHSVRNCNYDSKEKNTKKYSMNEDKNTENTIDCNHNKKSEEANSSNSSKNTNEEKIGQQIKIDASVPSLHEEEENNKISFANSILNSTQNIISKQQQQQQSPNICSSSSTPIFQNKTEEDISLLSSNLMSNISSSSNATGSPSASFSDSNDEYDNSLLVPSCDTKKERKLTTVASEKIYNQDQK